MQALFSTVHLLATMIAASCPAHPSVTIDVGAVHRPATVHEDFDTRELARMASVAARKGKHDPLGAYLGTIGYTLGVSFARGRDHCLTGVTIRVVLTFTDHRIEIGRDLRRVPCLYEAALAHYIRHANADDQALSLYARSVRGVLGAAPDRDVFEPGPNGLDEDSVKSAAKSLVDGALAKDDAKRDAMIAAIDTPEEVERLERSCSAKSGR